MNAPPGGPERYLFDGVVVVPGRVAYRLEQLVGLNRLRAQVRGGDRQVDDVLVALAVAAGRYAVSTSPPSGSNTGSALGLGAEVAGSSTDMSTTQAAELLHLTTRAVRLACAAGRLPASQVNGAWRLTPAAVASYSQKGTT